MPTAPASLAARLAGRLRRALRATLWLLLGALVGFTAAWTAHLDRLVRQGFAALERPQPTRVYARALELAPGEPLDEAMLREELLASRYREEPGAPRPGSFAVEGRAFLIHRRGFADGEGRHPPLRFRVELGGGRVLALADAAGRALAKARIDPARIATLYGGRLEERRPLSLRRVPNRVLTALQAVEDRGFKHHGGIDPLAVLRAAWVNLREGRLAQGGSTITQQLARQLWLSRERSLWRKLNEALIALLLEWRFDKGRILEAYLNEVYLGQQGAQAVHGFGAGAEFWFGKDLASLELHEIALLVGLIRGPSHYDPRRHPERALARRNQVLDILLETGLIGAAEAAAARAAPLGVAREPRLPRNQHPAFLELVERQLAADFGRHALAGAGLAVHTTLAPALQGRAERALAESLAALDGGGEGLQGAVVVTDAASGEILALAGDRDPRAHGFNRALAARRPIGSLVKPFVYLLALAEPGRFHLGTPLEDAPLALRLDDGRWWRPENADRGHRGRLRLIEALAQSRNLPTVRLGLAVGPERVRRLLERLSGARLGPAHPALLLGAAELTPLEAAQAYQFLANGGRLEPLRAVRAVTDGHGRALGRYPRQAASLPESRAVALVVHALQEAVLAGTARALAREGFLELRPAGKTGTSDDRRDSWFAGFSGSHLGLVWVGRDDYRPTGLMGATGALRVWAALFRGLPARPLLPDRFAPLEWAWVGPEGEPAAPGCPGARELPFLAGHRPEGSGDCRALWYGLRHLPR
ncbi:MAG: penicillin-binding protein 1B [Xanthomonadales bacterium]|nr:penicillin-binding protein 1B [Xanthomonadales bacterium]